MGFPGEVDESTPLLRRPQALKKDRWSAKHTLAVMGLFGIAVEYCQRVSLSVSIVSMVVSTNSSNSSSESFCPLPAINKTINNTRHSGEFDWDKTTQGTVLSSFFWGYACTNFIGGRVSEYIGGKRVFGFGILASSLLSLIGPLAARTSLGFFIACRVFTGLVQGVTFPSINSMLATWILPADRSYYSTIVYSGFQIGTVLGLMISGWLCNFLFWGGWPLPFYLFGLLGLLWCVIWYFLIHERPEDHPRISTGELQQLRESASSVKAAGVLPVPWREILTSTPFWSVIVVSIGNDYGFYTLLTELPTYLNDVQHYDIINNGLISSIPYLLMWVVSLVWAALMTFLTHQNKLTIVNVRRLSGAVALYGPMVGLIAMCFVNCDAVLAVVVLCLFGMLNGSVNSAHLCSHQDMAPNFAGTLLGITNSLGAISGIAAPAVTSAIIGDEGTLWEWRGVFLISIVLYFITCTIYIIFISADVQPWNAKQTKNDDLS